MIAEGFLEGSRPVPVEDHGVGRALDRLAQYYISLAEKVFPVIEVDATRQVNFIVQKGTALKLKSPS